MTARTEHRGEVLPLVARALGLWRDGRTLLDNVDLRVEVGPLTVIMGPNGAGKSLLLRLLAGLIAPDAGSVTWAGRAPDRVRIKRLGFVFQAPVLLRRSVADNLRYALRAAGIPKAEWHERTASALAEVGLDRLADAPARVLSGGEQQKLALARALAPGPEVLLMDEPTANLDPTATAAIEDRVGRARDAGTTIVFVTHDLGQAKRLAGRVVFLHRGRVTEDAPAARFFDAPASEPAAAFIEGRLLP
ncbi:MAG: ATP-binding cassette domain-containing protein [Alphaproteobacteria bacterium]|nr:ATP-binding cassette domain-containing protein [Alphaproteobacteria bacterium]